MEIKSGLLLTKWLVWLLRIQPDGSPNAEFRLFTLDNLGVAGHCLAIQFFDEIELVLVFVIQERRYVCTVKYADSAESFDSFPIEALGTRWTMADLATRMADEVQVSQGTRG